MTDDELAPGEPSPTLSETARRRADLHAALIAVERAISSPAGGRQGDWSKDVVRTLQDLDHAIVEHIEGAERPGGLYEEIEQKAPRLTNQIERLKEEHPGLRDTTRHLLKRLEGGSLGPEWPLPEARDDLQRLLGRLVRHRQLGADLVWDAYNLDIGGIE
ncbi:MAG TPA: hypothetical protein VF129_07160 [Actinomycetota bacterium]